MSSSASSPLGSSTCGPNAALVPSSSSDSSMPTTSPAASLVTKTRSMTRMRPALTSSPSAGATSPLNWLPGKPDHQDLDRSDAHRGLSSAGVLADAGRWMGAAGSVAPDRTGFEWRHPRTVSVATPAVRTRERHVENEAQWERHARWWQREFSAGADPEYEDQILPTGRPPPRGRPTRPRRRLRRGPGRPPTRRRRSPGRRARPRRGRRSRPRGSAAADRSTPGPGPRPCPAATDRSTPCWCARRSSTSTRSRTRSRRWPGCSSPADGSCSSSGTRCCRPRAVGGSTTGSSASSTGGSGSYLDEERRFDEVAPGVDLLFIHRPAQPLRPRHGPSAPADRRHGRGRPAARG